MPVTLIVLAAALTETLSEQPVTFTTFFPGLPMDTFCELPWTEIVLLAPPRTVNEPVSATVLAPVLPGVMVSLPLTVKFRPLAVPVSVILSP